MNWPKQNPPSYSLTVNVMILFFATTAILGCGVKGDPLPPERPVELGRGRPTYKRATEGLPIERAQPKKNDEDEDEDEDGR